MEAFLAFVGGLFGMSIIALIILVLRILGNVLRDRELRSRILEMRATFKHYRKNLTGIAIIARKPGNGNEGQR